MWLPVGSLARFRDREVPALTIRLAALALGGGVIWTWSLTSHGAATAGIGGAALFSDYLHLAASAFWVGALFHLAGGIPAFRRISNPRDRRALLCVLIPRFSLVAALSVGTLIVTGVCGGLALLGLLFMGAGVRLGGWFSGSGAGVMAPGLAGFVVGVVLLVNTQLGQPEQRELRNPFPPNPESLQAGRLVYQQHCETCATAWQVTATAHRRPA